VNPISVQQIINLNREIILRTGGFARGAGRLQNKNSLEYVVALVNSIGDGETFCMSVHEMAAALAFHIISGHVFIDGNKRTGMIAALWFLERNGWSLSKNVKENHLVQLALDVATNSISKTEIAKWFEQNSFSI